MSLEGLLLCATTGLAAAAVALWPVRSVGLRSTAPPRSPSSTAPSEDPGPTATSGSPCPARRWSTRTLVEAEERLADLLGLVAAPLRAGAPASSSLAAGAAAVQGDVLLTPVMADLVVAGDSGGSVSACWLEHADALDSEALRFVGRAWALSESTGAPLADALRSSEEVLRARCRSRRRLASAAAGPRASMAVLALLPLSGPVVGLACGIGPRQLYLATPWSLLSLALGVGFGVTGWAWSRSILRRAQR